MEHYHKITCHQLGRVCVSGPGIRASRAQPHLPAPSPVKIYAHTPSSAACSPLFTIRYLLFAILPFTILSHNPRTSPHLPALGRALISFFIDPRPPFSKLRWLSNKMLPSPVGDTTKPWHGRSIIVNY